MTPSLPAPRRAPPLPTPCFPRYLLLCYDGTAATLTSWIGGRSPGAPRHSPTLPEGLGKCGKRPLRNAHAAPTPSPLRLRLRLSGGVGRHDLPPAASPPSWLVAC